MEFRHRDVKNVCQVRFWANTESYKKFKEACDKQDLFIKDVFGDFIDWFSNESEKGTLNIKKSGENK